MVGSTEYEKREPRELRSVKRRQQKTKRTHTNAGRERTNVYLKHAIKDRELCLRYTVNRYSNVCLMCAIKDTVLCILSMK